MSRKNEAAVTYKGVPVMIWQDATLNWVYSINGGTEVSSQSKELQTALNLAYESVDEKADSPISRLIQKAKTMVDSSKPKKAKAAKARKVKSK